ncbi:MAG: hypothetical protein M9934_13620 [Thermomicrobiales bacterium]|nr:hypothetical protein [Thermomicrobiales bacterium]
MNATSISFSRVSSGMIPSDLVRFGQLLLITLRRFGLWIPVAIVAIVGIAWTHYGIGTTSTSVVLWSDISIYIAISSAIVGTGCGVLMSFYAASRGRRNIDDLLDSAAMPGWKSDTLTFALAACVGVTVYSLVAGWNLLAASRVVSWGAPYWVILIAGLATTVAYSMLGTAIGMIWPHRLAPFLTLITVTLIFVATAAQPGWHGNTTVRDLSLWNVLLDQQDVYSPWYATRWTTNLLDCIWLAIAISAVSATVPLAWRHRERSILIAAGVGLLTLLIPFAIVAGGLRPKTNQWTNMEHSILADIELVCSVGTANVEVCLHPAWESELDRATIMANDFITPVQGLTGVPTLIVQSPVRRGPGSGEAVDGMEARIHLDRYSHLEFAIPDAILSSIYPEGQSWTDAHNFLAQWLAERSGTYGPMHYSMGEVGPETPLSMTDIGEQHDSYDARIQSLVDRFNTLTPQQQRAWLEAHWDQLRDGSIDLDQLP